jgi:hypothetical protein
MGSLELKNVLGVLDLILDCSGGVGDLVCVSLFGKF